LNDAFIEMTHFTVSVWFMSDKPKTWQLTWAENKLLMRNFVASEAKRPIF